MSGSSTDMRCPLGRLSRNFQADNLIADNVWRFCQRTTREKNGDPRLATLTSRYLDGRSFHGRIRFLIPWHSVRSSVLVVSHNPTRGNSRLNDRDIEWIIDQREAFQAHFVGRRAAPLKRAFFRPLSHAGAFHSPSPADEPKQYRQTRADETRLVTGRAVY